jgi:hypothetical protein
MACDYKFCQKWSKILSILASIIYIVLGVGRFLGVLNALDPIDYIFNIYMMQEFFFILIIFY